MNTETAIEEGNRIIADFVNRYDGEKIEDCEDPIIISEKWDWAGTRKVKTRPFTYSDLQYHSSWSWLMPVWKECADIGLFMMTNGFDRLWLEKEKEIEDAIVREVDCKKAAILISMLIQWYNTQSKNTEP
jgi:hypothetical protein